MRSTKTLLAVLAACAVVAAGSASAAIVTGVTAIADSSLSPTSAPGLMTNNSGMSAPYDPLGTHAHSQFGSGMWLSSEGSVVQDLTFDLNGAHDLETFYVWQHNQAHPTVGDLTGRGVQQFDVLVSSDGFSFTEVLSNLTLSKSPSTPTTPVPVSAQPFSISETGVTHVRFHIDSHHGPDPATAGSGSYVGLAEVMFENTVIAPPPPILDTTLFNATTNNVGDGDDAPGLATGFSNSASVFGTDTVEDAFGNNDGGVESTTFIFNDAGTQDNGNGTIGDGGETVDFIEWTTTSAVNIVGYQIEVSGASDFRRTELMRFLVDGSEVDLYDNNGAGGAIERLFSGGEVTGSTFRIEITRSDTNGAGDGPRIIEIDALVAAVVVPEPSSLALFSTLGVAMLVGLGWRRRRASRR